MNQEALIERVAEETGIPSAAVAEYVDNIGVDDADTLGDDIAEAFAGEWRNLAEYAEELVADGCFGPVPDGSLAFYVDYEAIGRDLELGGDVWTASAPGGVFVFRNI